VGTEEVTLVEFANSHAYILDECGFLEWLPENLHVYAVFEHFADQIWSIGRHRYSARRICEGMRWEHEVRSKDEYKISNSVTSYLGRLYVLRHPTRLDFFTYQIKDGRDFKAYVSMLVGTGQL
jgi:hypothetical protein